VTQLHGGVHSDTFDDEAFALRHHQDRHPLADFTRGKIDDRTGLKRLTHIHTSWCHELDATIGLLPLR
jgi:hypothetical protein